MLISADPGCGKSVLAKYLIDEELPKALPGFMICYYFFKDQLQNKLAPALCAICHQLMIQDYDLLRKYAVPQYQRDQNIASNTKTLVGIIRDAVSDRISKPLVVIFDALDECETTNCKKLLEILEQLDDVKKLKIILTSRPYYGIVSTYETISSRLHIPGEEESDAIGKEVDIVIKQRLKVLCRQKGFNTYIRAELQSRLLSESHRTYLWVYLVFEELNTAMKMTSKELGVFFDSLPCSVSEAYERILSRSTYNAAIRNIVRATLSILLAAYRPLTTSELQYAVKAGTQPDVRDREGLDIEPDRDFIIKLRNWCGLFVQVYNDKVTFIHQTAREFLISSGVSDLQIIRVNDSWMGSCTIEQAHEVMARACIAYLLMSSKSFHSDDTWKWPWDTTRSLLSYAAGKWDRHVHDGSCSNDQELLVRMSLLCSPGTKACNVWLLKNQDVWETFAPYKGFEFINQIATTYVAIVACLRTDVLMKSALNDASTGFKKMGNTEERIRNREIVEMAIISGHPNNLRLLLNYALQYYVEVNLDNPLMYMAIQCNRVDCVKILLDHPLSSHLISNKKSEDDTYLGVAIRYGDLNMIKVLVEHGASIDELDWQGSSPLSLAIVKNFSLITAFLLDHGANIHALHKEGQTPLHIAVSFYENDSVSVLLDHGASMEAQDDSGSTPPHVAATGEYTNHVNLLIDRGADINARNEQGMTPLAIAVCRGYLETVKALLQHSAEVNGQDNRGRSILHHAIVPQLERYDLIAYRSRDKPQFVGDFLDREQKCGDDLIRLLLERGARLNLQDESGYTPLSLAAYYQKREKMKILLNH